mgnify:CR=1 FL=1
MSETRTRILERLRANRPTAAAPPPEYSKALGLELDASGFGMGTRGQRFSIIVEDGVATQVNIEGPGEFGDFVPGFGVRHLNISIAPLEGLGGRFQPPNAQR